MPFPRLNDLLPRWDFFKPLRVALRSLTTVGGDGVILESTTPATEDEPVQKPPRIRLRGAGWGTDDERTIPVEIIIEAVPVESATGEVEIQLQATVDDAAAIVLAKLNSAGRLVLGSGDGSSYDPPSGILTPTQMLLVDGTSSTPSGSSAPMLSLIRRWAGTAMPGLAAGLHIDVTNDLSGQGTMEVVSIRSRSNQPVDGDRIGLGIRMISEGEPGTNTSDFAIWPIAQKLTRVDSSGAEISLDNQYSRTISAATNATPIEITVTFPHYLETGDEVHIADVGGNTAANGDLWTITKVDATKFTLDTSVGSGSYTSGGTVYLHCSRDYSLAGNRGMPLGLFIGAGNSYGNATALLPMGSGDPTRTRAWAGLDIRPGSIAPETKNAIRFDNDNYICAWKADYATWYKLLGLASDDKVHLDVSGRTIKAGTGPTVLTDAAGKILSAALNTVAVADGGTGQTTTNFVRAYNSGAISINDNTETLLTFDSEHWDTNGLHSTSSNTGRLTAAVAGTYVITAHFAFASNSTGVRYAYIRKNGATVIALEKVAVAGAGGLDDWMSLSTIYRLSTIGDYVEVIVFQNSGGSLNVTAAGNHSPEFAMVRVSD